MQNYEKHIHKAKSLLVLISSRRVKFGIKKKANLCVLSSLETCLWGVIWSLFRFNSYLPELLGFLFWNRLHMKLEHRLRVEGCRDTLGVLLRST